MNTRIHEVMRPLGDGSIRAQGWLLLRKNALFGLSATRILIGIAMLGLLLTNFTSRHVLWGQGSFWAEPYREINAFGGFIEVFDVGSPLLFTLIYLTLIAIATAVILGWRTRIMALLLALGMVALVERASPMGDQGDNIARIGLLLMVFMNTAEYWSLDARRRARKIACTPKGERLNVAERLWFGLPVLPDWWTNLVHNCALIALACQIFILYTASALYKVQGSTWQAGTALDYPLSLHEYGVFPWLNALVTGHPLVLTTITYFSVFVQLFFAVGLLHPVTRRLFLLGVVVLHGGIAVLMGLPWFSLAMLAFDAIFVSSPTYRKIERLARTVGTAAKRRLPASVQQLANGLDAASAARKVSPEERSKRPTSAL